MKFLNLTNIRLFLMLVFVAFLYSFTANRNAHRKIKKTNVEFVGKNTEFLKQETVNKLLIEKNPDVKTIEKDELNLKKLENSINKNPMVEKSEVYVSVDGVLNAVVVQKNPIARVFNGNNSFYIDYDGNEMPLSNAKTARVPIVSGIINSRNKKDVANLLKLICDDEFLKENIIGIEILSTNDVFMKNRNFNYQIEFGKIINVEKKFKNYKAFFQKAVLDSTLYKYKNISLRYTQQVVCSK